MPRQLLLKNHNTNEVIDISFVKDLDLTGYLEDKFHMKIYYYRHNLLEDGTIWIDFGLYNWFLYKKEIDTGEKDEKID